MKTILRNIKLKYETMLFKLFSVFPLRNDYVIFESESDFSDNSYALYDYMKSHLYFKKYKAIWLVDDLKSIPDTENVIVIQKWNRGLGFKRAYYLAVSKYYFFDHCNVLGRYGPRQKQRIINLFHGCTFKKTKGVDHLAINTEELMLVTGDFWKGIMAEFVLCDENKTRSLGYPRNDYFFSMDYSLKLNINQVCWNDFDKVFLWMPTFRKTLGTTLSEDYYQGVTGLPILEAVDDLDELNDYCRNLNCLIVFKIHHLQLNYPVFKRRYSNIQIINDQDLKNAGLQLYSVIGVTDALITDYSSISNDYMLLNRPMIFTLDDYEAYRSSRGFSIDDPARYFPGHHVFNKDELFKALLDVVRNLDPYEKQRNELMPLMHKYQDGHSSKRIIEYIGM